MEKEIETQPIMPPQRDPIPTDLEIITTTEPIIFKSKGTGELFVLEKDKGIDGLFSFSLNQLN